MSDVKCLSCQEKLDIPEFVDIKNYDGEIVCKKCKARLAIKFVGSHQPVKYKLVEKPTREDKPVKIIYKNISQG